MSAVSIYCALCLTQFFVLFLIFAGGIFVLQIPPSCCKICSTGLWCNFLLFWTESCGTTVFELTDTAQHPKETGQAEVPWQDQDKGNDGWSQSILFSYWPSVSALHFFRMFLSSGKVNFVHALLPSHFFHGCSIKIKWCFLVTLLVVAVFWWEVHYHAKFSNQDESMSDELTQNMQGMTL